MPFKHVQIEALFESDDFEKIIASPEIGIPAAASDKALLQELFSRNYKIIDFPGCTMNYREYIAWHKDKRCDRRTNTACEGFGMVLRLESATSGVIKALQRFLSSEAFVSCIAEKFGIDPSACRYDAGIQKYLDGYEISPHPDILEKALTFMLNINPSPTSSDDEYHTSYLRFSPERAYVSEFWKTNPKINRCWVRWDWCEVVKQQRDNNSIVIFAPSHDTLHAVKANYDHLPSQRTQLYGNLFYNDMKTLPMPCWEDFHIEARALQGPANTLKSRLESWFPAGVTKTLRRIIGGRSSGG